MRDLGPLHETDRLLDALGSRQDPGVEQDAVVTLLAAWAHEVEPGPVPVVPGGQARRSAPRARRLAAGALFVALTVSGASVAAALTGVRVLVLIPVGEAIVPTVPGGEQLLAVAGDGADEAVTDVPAGGPPPDRRSEGPAAVDEPDPETGREGPSTVSDLPLLGPALSSTGGLGPPGG